MKQHKISFAKSAITLCVFLMVGKIIGAIYRLPLTWILGSVGIGIYQMIFPLYSLLLTVSSSAVPQALSKLISEKNAKGDFGGAKQIFIVASIWLIILSSLASILVCSSSKIISGLQGNINAFICYFGIAPAIIFVGIISAYRGYFQGHENMMPSGISSLIEQTVKMLAGLGLSYLFLPKGIEWGVFGALLGVSISEFVASLYLFFAFIFSKKRNKIAIHGLDFRACTKSIFSICLPVTLGGLILPLVQFIDSGLVVKLLLKIGYSQETATSLFGLSSGAVGSLINLPVVLSLSVATAVLPSISKNNTLGNNEKVNKTINKSFILTLLLTLPCVMGFIMLAKPIIQFLYGSVFSQNEINISAILLKLGAISIIFLALTQVSSGIMQGKGRFKIPMLGLIIGGALKIIFNLILIQIPNINIYGDQIANIVCYFSASLFNFIFIIKAINKKSIISFFKILFATILMGGFLSIFIYYVSVNTFWLLLIAILLAIIVYFVFIFLLFYKDLEHKKLK